MKQFHHVTLADLELTVKTRLSWSSVDQAVLELRDPPASVSRVLRLKSCAIKPIRVFLSKSKQLLELGRVRQMDICESEASLVYRVRPCPGNWDSAY